MELGQILESDNGSGSDNKAKREEEILFKRSKRESQADGHKHIMRLVFIWICFLLITSILVVRVISLIVPADKCWLSAEHVIKLDEFLIHGSVGAILVSILKPILMAKN